jgi:hypothetical protein
MAMRKKIIRRARKMTRYEKGLHRLSKLVRAVEKTAAERDAYIGRLENLINQAVTEVSNLKTQIFASGMKALSYGVDFKPYAPFDATKKCCFPGCDAAQGAAMKFHSYACNVAAGLKEP